jgi:hypothetical protein
MRFFNYLNRLHRSLRRGSPRQRPEKFQSRPRIEQLEDRLVPSTLTVDAVGNAKYLASPSVNNNVTLSERALGRFRQEIITDTSEKITVTGPGAFRFAGSGTNQVSTIFGINSLFVDVQDGNDVVNVQAINYSTTVVHSGPGVDTVNVGDGGSVQGIAAPLLVAETLTGGSTQLTVDDSLDNTNRPFVQLVNNQIIGLAPAPISYVFLHDNADSVTVLGGKGNNNYTVNDPIGLFTRGISTTLDTGSGLDSVTVQVINAPLVINGANNLFVDVGTPTTSLQSIKGPVTVTNTAAQSTTLNVDDFADPKGRTINVSDTAVTFVGLTTVNYQASALKQLTIVGSSGSPSNVWTVLNTPGGASTFLVTNTDGVNVQATTGALTVQNAGFVNVGKSGSVQGIKGELNLTTNALTVDDSTDPVGQHVLFSSNVLVGLAPAHINYNFNLFSMRVKGGIGANVFTIADTPTITSAFYTTLDTGTGADTVTVLRTTTPLFITGHNSTDTVNIGGGTLANIKAFVYIDETQGKDHLTLDDSLDKTNRVVDIADGAGAGTVNGLTPPLVSIFYNDVSDLTINGGKASDYFRLLLSPGSQTPITINGGAVGFNTLDERNFNNLWNITGHNAGQVRNVSFTSIQDLAAGNGKDTFHFTNGAALDGFIGGGGGFDTLDYSAYTTPVFVNLTTGTATGVGAGVYNIYRVIGGSAGNVLIGAKTPGSVLVGGSGRDLLIAGSGGNTLLLAGSDEAILIGGTTDWDANAAALHAIFAEWSHTYDSTNALHDYQIRVGHLESGGGLNGSFRLNPATVHSNLVKDTLVTNLAGGLDFVFLDGFDLLPNPHRTGEVYVPV